MELNEYRNLNLKFEVLEEIFVKTISNTQEIRVLLIRDEKKQVKTSLQKWWRADDKSDWNLGKGFFLDGDQAYSIGKALTEVGSRTLHIKN